MAKNIPTYPDLAGKVALVTGGLEASGLRHAPCSPPTA